MRSVSSSTVQVGGIAGTTDVRTVSNSTIQIGSQPTMSGTQDVSLGNSTVDVRTVSNSTIQAVTKFAGVNYAPIHKNSIYLGSTAQAALWVPAAGLKINLTDMAISASTAAQVDIIVGNSTIGPFFFGNNGGLISNYNTPTVASANGTMFVASSGGTITVTTDGFER